MEKLKSRKFWICIAAFLGSVAASIAGLRSDNQVVAAIGVVAGIVSAAIYAFCEAWVDASAAVYRKEHTEELEEEEYYDDEVE